MSSENLSLPLENTFGTDFILTKIAEDKTLERGGRERIENALNKAWSHLIELMEQGGAITLEGDILKGSIDDMRLPPDVRSQLMEHLTLGVKAEQFTRWTELPVDLKFDYPQGGVHLVERHFDQYVTYREDRDGRITPGLVLPSGEVRINESFPWLKSAFQDHVRKTYESERAAVSVVTPSFAVSQLLADVADSVGKGGYFPKGE